MRNHPVSTRVVFVGSLLVLSLIGCQRDSLPLPTDLGDSASQRPPASVVATNGPQNKAEMEPIQTVAPTPKLLLDGRSTEDWVPLVNERLAHFAQLVAAPTPENTARLVAQDYTGAPFFPQDTAPIYDDGEYVVLRGARRDTAADHDKIPLNRLAPQSPTYSGPNGFFSAAREWANRFSPESIHVSTHVVQTMLREATLSTRVQVELNGETDIGLVEQNAEWQIEWCRTGTDSLAIQNIEVLSFEEVRRTTDSTLFTDLTAAVCEQAKSFQEQMRHDHSYWRDRIERHHVIDKSAHHGLAIGDVNGDGWDDVYLCQPGGLPNRLLAHHSNGTVRDISAASGTDILDNTRSALLIDFDNDRAQDLILATASGVLFFRGDGQGQFVLANHIPSIRDAYSMVAADYDNDGDLDIYACRYYPDDADPFALPIPTPYFDARNGGSNFLIRNDGDWRTLDATTATGLDQHNNRYSYAAMWVDFDQDGDQDLYVANDFGRNNLYENQPESDRTPQFVDVAEARGMQDGAFGMSASCGDFNCDGSEDIYVGNMFSSAGNRIARLPTFRPELSPDMRDDYVHLARGNTLFANLGGQRFEDVSVAARVTQGRWSWGSLFADLNNDGWQDLIVANGYITGSQPSDDL